MIVGEPDAPSLLVRVERTTHRITSPLAVWETATAVSRIIRLPVNRATQRVLDYIDLLDIELRPVPAEAPRLALDAFDRFGKGRHPAALNFGDCFAYACARHFDEPLLFKGSDFTLTDIEAA
jgi:ribonuclease VapC